MSETKPQDTKKSLGKDRYANPPKIKMKGGKSSAPADAGSKHSPGTASVTDTHTKMETPGAAPSSDVMAGTDGIPVHERHATERSEMLQRHMAEMQDMHKRHQKDHDTMTSRHASEMGVGMDGQTEPNKGK